MLSFDELRRENVARCEESYHPLDEWSPTDWATALAGEVGEACNFIKKIRRLQSDPCVLPEESDAMFVLLENVEEELADVVIYADLLAARLHIDLGLAVKRKFNVVSGRIGSPRRLYTTPEEIPS